MLPYYAYFALDKFKDIDSKDSKFHSEYGASVLFNSDAGNMPRFNCSYGHQDSMFGENNAYSPDKIQEAVINPSPVVDPPNFDFYYDTLFKNQSDQNQAIKNAIGSDFLYDGQYANMKGVRLSDNYKQKLEVMNAMRYTSYPPFGCFINIQTHTRTRIYSSTTGELESDSGYVTADSTTSLPDFGYYYIATGNNHVTERGQRYTTFDVDFSGHIFIANSEDLIENIWLYREDIIEGVKTYYSKIMKLEDGGSYTIDEPPAPIVDYDETYKANTYGIHYTYPLNMYATSLKEMTMEDLANHYQVPY